MSNKKFASYYFSPYIFILFCLIVTDALSPAIFRGIASQREVDIAEFPFRFDLPEIKKTSVPEALRSPIMIARKEFPQISLEKLAPHPGGATEITLLMVSEDRRIAIINGIVLKEGDAFGNGRILRIGRDGVIISEMGKLREITVPPR
ncbi:MAG: general secretion pathway protein GspB [Thermodesulfovibrionales bacterium]|nr:general secretion pathway protein GspB [Thermodesulfovibrionales bacterium]